MNSNNLPDELSAKMRAIKSEYESIQCPAHVTLKRKPPQKKIGRRMIWLATAAAVFLTLFLPMAFRDLKVTSDKPAFRHFAHLPVIPHPPSGKPSLAPSLSAARKQVNQWGDLSVRPFKMPSRPTLDQFSKK